MPIIRTRDSDSTTWSHTKTGEYIIFRPAAPKQHESLYIQIRVGSPRFTCVDRQDLVYDFNNLTGENPSAPKYMITLAKKALKDITVAYAVTTLFFKEGKP